MRILVISGWCPWPPKNGSRLRAYHLLRQLATRHEIRLLSFCEPEEDTPQTREKLAELATDVQLVRGAPHRAEGSLGISGLFHRVPRSYLRSFSSEMARRADDAWNDLDLVMAMGVGATVYLRNRLDLPRVFEEAEPSIIWKKVAESEGLLQAGRAYLTWLKTAAYMREVVAQFSRTTVVSEQEQACLGRAGADVSRVTVVPNGVDSANLELRPLATHHRLIFNGSLTYGPNLEAMRFFVRDVWPSVRAHDPALELWITGAYDGCDLKGIKDGIGVFLTGYLPDIQKTVIESRACVVPLLSGGGTRLKILEAMSLGVPVVATSRGAEGLDLRHGEDVLIADGPREFADATLSLIRDPKLAATIGAAARLRARRDFTWERCGLALESALEQACRDYQASITR